MTEPAPELRASPLGSPQKLLDLFCEAADLLLPLLKPYEAVFYIHFFRHSWLETGQPLVRLTYRSLKTEVVKTMLQRGRLYDLGVCAGTIRQSLGGLARLGAIQREEAARSNGAVYRVFVPDQIEACRQRRAEKARLQQKRTDDFYNVRENRQKVYERDSYTCRYCRKLVTPYTATLDHLIPVIAGGDNSFDNLVTACLECNSRKHVKSVGDFLADQNPM